MEKKITLHSPRIASVSSPSLLSYSPGASGDWLAKNNLQLHRVFHCFLRRHFSYVCMYMRYGAIIGWIGVIMWSLAALLDSWIGIDYLLGRWYRSYGPPYLPARPSIAKEGHRVGIKVSYFWDFWKEFWACIRRSFVVLSTRPRHDDREGGRYGVCVNCTSPL